MTAKPRYANGALPAAYLLAAIGFACLRFRARILVLVLVILAWTPNLLSIYRGRLPWLPMRQIAKTASADTSASDLILVHSIPSGVINIARYVNGPAAMASWIGQLGNRRIPESVQQLAAGRTRIIFVKVHEVAQPAPEEDWLRASGVAVKKTHLGIGTIIDFRPKEAATF